MKAIRLLQGLVTSRRVFRPLLNELVSRSGLQLKQVSPERIEGALFLDSGGLGAATEHLTSLDKQVVDNIPSTPDVSSRTRKRKSDSTDEVRCWFTYPDHGLTYFSVFFQNLASNI